MDIRELHQKAESGSTVAQCVLGICYLDGIEVQVDYQKALRFLSSAANQGASRAVLNLARMHAEGLGIPKDPHEAIRLYESIGEVEFLAAIELGRIYSRGVGVAVDKVNASRWYSAAVAQEDRVADCDELREAKAYLKNR
jgi:uncharacterized protein